MATVTKDFKVKNGLIVEGTTGTINNHDILTKKTDDQTYIVNLIGGTATSANEANKVVKRDASGNFAANEITADLVGDVTGNADTATTLETARTIELTGDVTGSVSFNGSQNVQISTTLNGSFATDAEVATAKSEAISAAASDATTKANAAQAAAEATAAADATTKANAAQAAAISAAASDATTKANAAEAAAKAYADDKVSDLVDGAPALLDTLNELAAAIADNPNYATDVANLVAGKQDTLTPGTNIAIVNDVISVTGLDTDDVSEGTNLYFTNQRALDATAAAYDSHGSALAAEQNAATYTDNAINALDTDDIEEGASNLYHTSTRAKSAAMELLVNSNQSNITIAYNNVGDGLLITAENGVADSDTDDLDEGTTNLYFTNARAVSALEAVTPDFPAVEIANIAKQVAAEASVATASTSTAVSWAKADYKSAEFLVKIAQGSHTEVSKVILTLDTSDNVAITEYAMVGTNGSLGSVSADVSGSDVRLRVATLNNNSTVAVVGTLLK
jgi:hypothetical protein